jgi:DNA-binding LacI/PurR family transcriptional regulator
MLIMPSVREIADHAGVSKSTVSLVLNRKNGVSAQMREHVLRAVEELKARPSARVPEVSSSRGSAASPRNAERLTILALHPTILSSTQYFSEALQGIQQGIQLYNAQLSLAINEPELPDEHVTSLYFSQPSLRPDGVIVFGTDHYEHIGHKTQELGIPCVFLGVPLPGTRMAYVAPDEEAAAYEATRYLVDMGHQDIAFICGDSLAPATNQRMQGYEQALNDAGLSPGRPAIYTDPGPDGATTAVARFVDESPAVTAALFGNNHASRVGLPVLREARVAIPDDLSVIVFDDTDFQRTYDPPITTITYPLIREGLWAVRVLIDMMQEPMLASSQILFGAALTVRKSCAPPRDS